MSYSNLSVSLTAEQKADIISKINSVKSSLHFLVNLTSEERQRLRKVAEKRQGYINDVLVAVKANPDAIPAAIDIEEFYKDAQLFLDLSEIFSQLRPLFEGISDTYMAAGNEAITASDQCYGYLQIASRGNSNLKETIKQIGKHFDGQGRRRDKKPSEE